MAEKKGEVTRYKVRKKKLNITRLLILLIVLGVVVYFVISAVKIINLNSERAAIEKENQELREKVEDLTLQKQLVDSKEYMEGLARKRLKLVKPNEILFVLPDIRVNEDGEGTVFESSTERAAEEAHQAKEAMAEEEAKKAEEQQNSENAEGSGEQSGEGSGNGENNG
ncbi:MAG: septum formation initiator family protein [Firmicutes bacterium]|nr:septum formation initiator family protein [Bacillota bacterium]